MKVKWIVAAGVVSAALTGTAHAGAIYLHEGANGEQDIVGSANDYGYLSQNFKESRGRFVNDEAVSVRMEWVAPGTVIELFDDPSAGTGDDWVRIEVKGWSDNLIVRSLETNEDNPWFKVTWNRKGCPWYNPGCNKLNGKVSHIRIHPTQMGWRHKPESRVYFRWDGSFGGFPNKTGHALEYHSSGSNYRVYRPRLTQNYNAAWDVSFKQDHIRGYTLDDHAITRVQLAADGSLAGDASVAIEIKNLLGNDEIFSIFVPLAEAIHEAFKDNPKASKYTIIAKMGLIAANQLHQKLVAMGESGGRTLFSSETGHNINKVLEQANVGIDNAF